MFKYILDNIFSIFTRTSFNWFIKVDLRAYCTIRNTVALSFYSFKVTLDRPTYFGCVQIDLVRFKLDFSEQIFIIKGQLISKAIYGVLDSPKKPTKNI